MTEDERKMSCLQDTGSQQPAPSTRRGLTWHIITCEYPPQIGGVTNYTRQLAQASHPRATRYTYGAGGAGSAPQIDGVEVHPVW